MSNNLFRAFVLAVGALLIASGSVVSSMFGGLAVVYALWEPIGHGDEVMKIYGKSLANMIRRVGDVEARLKGVEERP